MAKRGKRNKNNYSEIAAVILIALGLISLVSMFWPDGWLTGFAVRALRFLVGNGCYFFPVLLILAGVRLMRPRDKGWFSLRLYGILLLFATVIIFYHLPVPLDNAFRAGLAGTGGGVAGALFSFLLKKSVGNIGAYIVLVAAAIIALMLLTNMSLFATLKIFLTKAKGALGRVWPGLKNYRNKKTEPRVQNNPPPPVIIDQGIQLGEPAVAPGKWPDLWAPDDYSPPLENDLEPDPEKELPEENPGDIPQKAAKKRGKAVPERDYGADINVNKNREASVYQYPPTDLLAKSQQGKDSNFSQDVNDNVRLLEETLESFGVEVKVVQVSRGPSITRYELQPSAGVKVSKITGLSDDIALRMAARSVRIEAPIPGKAAVGIEIPNKKTAMVHLRDMLETKEFIQRDSKLTISLGMDIAGNPVVSDLTKMPHLLIAGATGSGKSVCINTLIVSILYKATPDEVKFIMIDPKVVELTMYNGIPHLVSPVVTDPKKAASSLRWAVREMERRYGLFATSGVRDIDGYNQLFTQETPDFGVTPPPEPPEFAGQPEEPDLPELPEGPEGTQPEEAEQPLPLIVVLIDELADLMMVAPADVEEAICRLAQKARAAGIHLVVATQRPSVDVITGLIKANIPSRISFAVSSQVDSRTILDMAGAEKLLGQGDMFFHPLGAGKPQRVQGAFLADKEVETLVSYLKKQAAPVYDEEITSEQPEEEKTQEIEDELLAQAVKLVIESGQASASLLQRRMRIGFARAGRLIDIMERRRIIGGYEGSKPRTVIMTMEQYYQIFNNN